MPGTTLIAAICGTAGVGKTTLALHWASRVTECFPDGQLYVNLCGYDPGQPVQASDALSRLLRSLGLLDRDIPAEVEERAARYRSLLCGRRTLIVLDNARDAEQVRPLLPGTPTCSTVVTSRDALSGLIAREGACRLNLDVLPLAEAVGLLQELIGEQASADPKATETLAAQCCRLPLALRVAAELAGTGWTGSLADLVIELADQRRRLHLLDAGGDPHTALRTVFSWSYRQLDDATARCFRLIGLHSCFCIDRNACATLTGSTAEQAGQMLEVLVRGGLVQATGSGRYGMHELMRSYACELAANNDQLDQCRYSPAARISRPHPAGTN